MELILKQIPYHLSSAEFVAMDRYPTETFKWRLLQEVFAGTKIRIHGASELSAAQWRFDGLQSLAFTIGTLVPGAMATVEGPLVAQLPAEWSTSTYDKVYAAASYGLKFTEDGASLDDAMVIRDDMVCYRHGHLTWILGGSLNKTGEMSQGTLELAAAAAVAVALGATPKAIASGLRRFRAGAYATLERQLVAEVLV